MTDETFSLAALVLCRTSDTPLIAETLLSLAAQTHPDFEIHVIVADSERSGIEEVRELVGTFGDEFSGRVTVVEHSRIGSGTPLASGVARTGASYVAALYPDDVVFAHWAETFARHGPSAGGRALSSLVAVQAVEATTTSDGRSVTTVERPKVARPSGFDLIEHLLSPPLQLRGLALPRLALQRVTGQPLPPAAEGWAVRLAVGLSCGIVETGEVTYLERVAHPAGSASLDEAQWVADRRAALDALGRCGLTVGSDFLSSLDPSTHRSPDQLQAEIDLLRAQLRQAEDAARTHAEAERRALDRVGELLSSASWRASAPLRAFGEVARRRGRAPRTP
jgi:hypothetical protein